MSKKEVVETIHGKYHKYEIIKDSGGTFGSPKFYINRDGSYYKGSYSRLDEAVEKAKKEG